MNGGPGTQASAHPRAAELGEHESKGTAEWQSVWSKARVHTFGWRVHRPTPAVLLVGWHSWEPGGGGEHAGAGTRQVAEVGPVDLSLSLSDGGDQLALTAGRTLASGQRTSVTSYTPVPPGATLEPLMAFHDQPVPLGDGWYATLWRGRWVRDGRVVKTIQFAARLTADPAATFLGPGGPKAVRLLDGDTPESVPMMGGLVAVRREASDAVVTAHAAPGTVAGTMPAPRVAAGRSPVTGPASTTPTGGGLPATNPATVFYVDRYVGTWHGASGGVEATVTFRGGGRVTWRLRRPGLAIAAELVLVRDPGTEAVGLRLDYVAAGERRSEVVGRLQPGPAEDWVLTVLPAAAAVERDYAGVTVSGVTLTKGRR
jgi:hypothetical protein